MPDSTRRVGRDRAGEVGEGRQVERAAVGEPAGGGEPGRLVEQAEHLRHHPAVDVGVDEQRRPRAARPARWRARRRRWCGPARPVGPHTATTLPAARRRRRAGRRAAAAGGRSGRSDWSDHEPACPAVGPASAVDRLDDGGGDGRRRGVGRQHGRRRRAGAAAARPPRPPAGPARRRRRSASGEPGQRVAVEPAQVGRQQRRAGLAGGGGGEQVGEVDAAPHDGHPELAALQGVDELGLPDGVRDGGEDGDAH